MPALRLKLIGGTTNLGLSSKVLFKWHGKRVEEELYKRLTRNLKEATELYRSTVEKVFKSQPWGSVPVAGFDLRKRIKNSPAGGPPYKQTGNLANSVVKSFKLRTANSFFSGTPLRGRTSTEVKYAQNIELGGPAVYIPQVRKIHTPIRLVNPIPRRRALKLNISPRPVWKPQLKILTPKILKILAK